MSECTHNCETCGQDCASREPQSMQKKPHEMSSIKKVIGVVSGKGGVGKSLVTSLTATMLQRRGFQTAILDADITGPSIPKAFGINKERAQGNDMGLFPVMTKTGIEVMSVNLLLEEETTPLIWRGSLIAGTVTQFWTDVIWNDVDFLFVDMPPGTGDVPLTVFQSLPVDGILVVTSPQDLVSMIVGKAIKMAEAMNIPVLGLVENYSYALCPDCGKKLYVFGESKLDAVAAEYSLPILARLPMDPTLASAVDKGLVELFDGDYVDTICDRLEQL